MSMAIELFQRIFTSWRKWSRRDTKIVFVSAAMLFLALIVFRQAHVVLSKRGEQFHGALLRHEDSSFFYLWFSPSILNDPNALGFVKCSFREGTATPFWHDFGTLYYGHSTIQLKDPSYHRLLYRAAAGFASSQDDPWEPLTYALSNDGPFRIWIWSDEAGWAMLEVVIATALVALAATIAYAMLWPKLRAWVAALYWKRRRIRLGPDRCTRCTYNLVMTDGTRLTRCPECGSEQPPPLPAPSSLSQVELRREETRVREAMPAADIPLISRLLRAEKLTFPWRAVMLATLVILAVVFAFDPSRRGVRILEVAGIAFAAAIFVVWILPAAFRYVRRELYNEPDLKNDHRCPKCTFDLRKLDGTLHIHCPQCASCPKCSYSISQPDGTRLPRCPECGTDTQQHSSLTGQR
jgi:DNA-directed RNA polymerase subunit RPC12/RpoP